MSLRGTQLTDAGVPELKTLQSLQVLWLDRTSVSEAGLEWITGLSGLRELGLRNCPVGDGLVELVSNVPQLGVLNVFGTQLTEEGVAELRKRLPDCEIIR
mgnify:CR=1 FL=1